MKHNIIQTDNYLLVVDDSEIKEGDWIFANQGVHIVTDVKDDKYPYGTLNNKGDKIYHHKSWKKITSHLPLNNSPILEGVPLLPPLEDEVEKLANKWAVDNADITMESNSALNKGFKAGYNKAKEKYKYTEEEYNKLLSFIKKIDDEGYDPYDSAHHLQVSRYVDEARNIIQSLQQPKYPVGFECEVNETQKPYDDSGWMEIIETPKTATNSQGQTVLVGTYKYE